ncbi:ubiquitin-related domain-containing protein, partial [Chytriomyces sp. MP71]
MRITIRSVRGPVFSFCVDEAATVAQLKLLLEGIEGIAAAQQRLVFNGIQLADSLQLLHYGVGDGSILY